MTPDETAHDEDLLEHVDDAARRDSVREQLLALADRHVLQRLDRGPGAGRRLGERGTCDGGDAPPSFGATSQTSIAPPPKASCGGDIG